MKNTKKVSWILIVAFAISMTALAGIGARAAGSVSVTGVGIFDQNPNKGLHTFNESAKLFQVTFSGNFYDPDEVVGGQKLWVQSELGPYIILNGKTVAQWNEIEFNSVQIHVKVSEALGGQYLEFNFNGHEGLPKETEDATIIFLKEMPVYEGALSEDFEFSYKAGNTSAWILKKQQAAETSDFAVPAIIAAVILIACSGSVAKKRMRK